MKLPEIAEQMALMVKKQRLLITPVNQEMLIGALTYYQPVSFIGVKKFS